ncbi:hypothetical protein HNR46_000925 [Haloferula luteola]|uniref:Rod shape-determining protein MreD n=1 Tax=Haloferula luteola TaxID=595692 RepID=A0A840UX16_9BACT|nr:hypothetical protein [Haloferula luteola]MBB5350697.1 hypothetical protein [Haloferula luteola]
MIRYLFSILIMVLLAVIAQQFLPALTALSGCRILPVALVFLCAAVTLPPPAMLLVAFVCGFLTDLENWMGPHGGDRAVYEVPVETLRFGYSIILYGIMGMLMQGIRPLFRRGNWQFSALLGGIAVFLYLTTEYLLINFIRGGFSFGQGTLMKITFSSALTTLFAPLVFWILFALAERFNYTIRLDTSRRRPGE